MSNEREGTRGTVEKRIEKAYETALGMPYRSGRFKYDFVRCVAETVASSLVPPGAVSWFECFADSDKNRLRLFGKWPQTGRKHNTARVVAPPGEERRRFTLRVCGRRLTYVFCVKVEWVHLIACFFRKLRSGLKSDSYIRSMILDWTWISHPEIRTAAEEWRSGSRTSAEMKKTAIDCICRVYPWYHDTGTTELMTFIDARMAFSSHIHEHDRALQKHIQRTLQEIDKSKAATDWVKYDHLQVVLSNIERLLDEDRIIWQLREELFGFFSYYLNAQCRPYFFIYDPFTRNFFYRGLLERDLPETLPNVCFETEFSNPREIQNELSQACAVVDMPQEEHDAICAGRFSAVQDRHCLLRIAEDQSQFFNTGLNSELHQGQEMLWIDNLMRDWVAPTLNASERTRGARAGDALGVFEEHVLGIYTNSPYLICPIFRSGQYEGNVFIRHNRNALIESRLRTTAPALALSVGRAVERQHLRRFRYAVTKDISALIAKGKQFAPQVGFESIIRHLPNLFNGELAGYLCLRVGDNASVRCANVEPELRMCRMFGFGLPSHSPSRREDACETHLTWQSLGEGCKCRKQEGDGRYCLWKGLYEEVSRLIKMNGGGTLPMPDGGKGIGGDRQGIVFKVSLMKVEDLQRIATEHVRSEGLHVSILQSFPWRFDGDVVAGKSIIVGFFRTFSGKDQLVHCLWVASDTTPHVWSSYRGEIDERLREIMQNIEALQDATQHIRASEWQTLIYGVAHEMGHCTPQISDVVAAASKCEHAELRELAQKAMPALGYLRLLISSFGAKREYGDLFKGEDLTCTSGLTLLLNLAADIGYRLSGKRFDVKFLDDLKSAACSQLELDLERCRFWGTKPQEDLERRLASETLLLAALSNMFQHLVVYVASRYPKPHPDKERMSPGHEKLTRLLRIRVTKDRLKLVNATYTGVKSSWYEQRVGTSSILRTVLSLGIWSTPGVLLDPTQSLSDEHDFQTHMHVQVVILPGDFWATEAD